VVSAGVQLLLWNLVDHFLQQDVSPPYQPGPSLPRTGVIRTRRFQPYEISHTLPNEHGNAEAGSSALVPLPLPYVGPPTPQPSGGVSEAPANAETNNTTIEEDKVPVSNFYCSRIPHMAESLSGVRPLNGLGALAARDDLARTACGHRELLTSCVPGGSNKRASQHLRPSMTL